MVALLTLKLTTISVPLLLSIFAHTHLIVNAALKQADMRRKLLKDLAAQYRRNAERKKGQLRQEAAQGQRRRRAAARLSATSDVHVEARSEDTQQGAQEQGSDVSTVEPTAMEED